MFTRIVELTSKPGKNKQLADTIDDKVLPILKKQKGFVDETVFVSDKEDNRVLAQGFWNTKEDADQYQRAEYQKVHETIRHLLESEPVIRTFNVYASTSRKIAAGKAAGSRG
jgi:quinol monooxygenase YgiN